MHENEISYAIRGAIFKIFQYYGPGLFESIYEAALFLELKNSGLTVQKQVGVPVEYEDTPLNLGFRIDLLVENKVLIEIKSIEHIAEVHFKQVLTYLRLRNLKLGILVNFTSDNINNSIYRIVNNL